MENELQKLEILLHEHYIKTGMKPIKIKLKNKYFDLLLSENKHNKITFSIGGFDSIFGIPLETGNFDKDYEFVFEKTVLIDNLLEKLQEPVFNCLGVPKELL